MWFLVSYPPTFSDNVTLFTVFFEVFPKMFYIYSLELGYIGYLLLYALTLYNVDEEKLLKWELPERDIKTIRLVG